MRRRAAAGVIARWLCTPSAAGLVLAWITSAWWCASWRSPNSDSIAFILKGRVEVYISKTTPLGFVLLGPPPAGFSAGAVSRLWMWDQSWQWRPWARAGSFGFHAIIPLWLPVACTGAPALVLWRRRLRTRSGCCARCGYDLSGLKSGAPCPECGAARPAPGNEERDAAR
jgi:hypothetical protein